MIKSIRFIGMDVHKNSISIAIAEEGRNGEIRNYGKINNNMTALSKVIRKLLSDNCELSFVYEAGPCGYEIYRYLISSGFSCEVVAPSLIPKKSGDRIKNDRRDAQMLARLYRAGELTPVYVPDLEDEAMRDLTRAREDAKHCQRKAKQRLNAFLLRHGFIYSGQTKWSKAHFHWISDIKMAHPAQQITLQEYISTLDESSKRVERLTQQIRELAPSWKLYPVVKALQTLRGVSLIVASTTVAELGDLKRFESPACLMAYLGLVPSEHSSGETTKRGRITKTGNGHVRRVLIEAAWAYRFPARISHCLLNRQQDSSSSILEISWNAQLRLCSRYRKMIARKKTQQLVITAIARELSAFMWAIAQEVPLGQ
jgi:transposase